MKKNGITNLLKRFWVFGDPALQILCCMFPLMIVWRNYFPESYYGTRFTMLGELSIFVLMPFGFVACVYEFWKQEKACGKK